MEATKEEYPSTSRNQDIVEDPERISRGYIVAYRREICKGKPVGSIDGPYHVADIYEYTKKERR